MSKTTFVDGNPQQQIEGTIVTAAFLNALNNHRHRGLDVDGDGALDYAVATGSANAYAITLSPALDAYISGMPIIFQANHENTGTATLNVNTLGAKTLKKYGGRNLSAGDIKNGQIIVCCYDGTYLQIVSAVSAVPVGAEMLWPSETPPEGWLEEDGASLVRATYPALFALIGTMYGTADSTHFNLPDARGRFPRSWAHGQTTDPDRATRTVPTAPGATISVGDHVGTNQADEFKSHTHIQDIAVSASGFDTGAIYNFTATGVTGASGGNETRPINTYRMMIVKAY